MTKRPIAFSFSTSPRYKYPPVWVKTADLFDAMNTPDPDNDNKTRGYVLISSQASAGDALKP